MKEFDLKWRYKHSVGKIIISDEMVDKLFKSDCALGMAPRLLIYKDTEGKVVDVEIVELSLIPREFLGTYKIGEQLEK